MTPALRAALLLLPLCALAVACTDEAAVGQAPPPPAPPAATAVASQPPAPVPVASEPPASPAPSAPAAETGAKTAPAETGAASKTGDEELQDEDDGAPRPRPGGDPAPSSRPSPSPSEPPGPARPEPRPIVKEGAVTRFPGIRVFVAEKRIEVDGYVNLNECPTLEFMGCTQRGKTHETLLRFECEPKQLHLALLMIGLVPTPQVSEQGQAIELAKGERVVVEVAWWAEHTPKYDDDAPKPVDEVVTRRVEDLIWDRNRQGPMPRVGWVFTGSRMIKVPAPPDWETLQEVYAASYEGNIVATYHHPHVILDTPLLEGGDDTIYVPYTARTPGRGTPVTIKIRPWRDGDGPKELPKPAPRRPGADEPDYGGQGGPQPGRQPGVVREEEEVEQKSEAPAPEPKKSEAAPPPEPKKSEAPAPASKTDAPSGTPADPSPKPAEGDR
ncbi:MAG: YdjY domain-containing protein [Planctomycetota bacterium]